MKIRITNGKGWYREEIGEIFEVTGRAKDYDGYYVKAWDDEENEWVTDSFFVSDGNYEVIEEPKTHVIDGKTFVEVERKAKVGEKVIVLVKDRLGTNGFNIGDIFEITHYSRLDTVGFRDNNGTLRGHFFEKEYRVLEPVDQAPDTTADIIANLVRRVHSLEQQLRDTQRNVERQGVEIANIEAVTKAPQSGAKLLAEAFEALAKYERSVGR